MEEQNSISVRAVPGALPRALRDRGSVRRCVGIGAVAGGIRVCSMRGTRTSSVPSFGSEDLSVQCMRPSGQPVRWYFARPHPCAAAEVVPCGLPACAEQNQPLGIGTHASPGVSYNAAWRIKHKLMQLMANAESQRKLSDFVQIDDAYLGGERTGSRPGRGSENKVPIVVAVSTTDDGRPRQAVITPIASFSKRAIAEWAACHLDSACEVYTDGLSAFDALEERGHPRTLMVTEGRRAACVAPGANWVNTVLSNVKRAIDGRYHAFKFRKYADRYLSEATWRFNRRFNLANMAGELIRALAGQSMHWSESRLRHQLRPC